jgi:hypothetical protein
MAPEDNQLQGPAALKNVLAVVSFTPIRRCYAAPFRAFWKTALAFSE